MSEMREKIAKEIFSFEQQEWGVRWEQLLEFHRMIFLHRADSILALLSAEREGEVEKLREVLKKSKEAMSDLINIATESRGIDGWHMNGDILFWEQCEPLQDMIDALAKIEEVLK